MHDNKKLQELHEQHEYRETALTRYLKEIVYGGTDGIITTFAVVAGFSGAGSASIPLISVILFGLANLLADGVSMALGNFLSIRADSDLYRSEKEKELREIQHDGQIEQEETKEILVAKGFSKSTAENITKLFTTNPSFWTEFMLANEHKLENPDDQNPIYSALATFTAFVLFGSIPLFPYIFQRNDAQQLFLLSILFTAIALVTLGYLRYLVTREALVRSVAEVAILGGSAASIAYIVGTFFRL